MNATKQAKTRVLIGKEIGRWDRLKLEKGFKSNAAFAKFLLDTLDYSSSEKRQTGTQRIDNDEIDQRTAAKKRKCDEFVLHVKAADEVDSEIFCIRNESENIHFSFKGFGQTPTIDQSKQNYPIVQHQKQYKISEESRKKDGCTQTMSTDFPEQPRKTKKVILMVPKISHDSQSGVLKMTDHKSLIPLTVDVTNDQSCFCDVKMVDQGTDVNCSLALVLIPKIYLNNREMFSSARVFAVPIITNKNPVGQILSTVGGNVSQTLSTGSHNLSTAGSTLDVCQTLPSVSQNLPTVGYNVGQTVSTVSTDGDNHKQQNTFEVDSPITCTTTTIKLEPQDALDEDCLNSPSSIIKGRTKLDQENVNIGQDKQVVPESGTVSMSMDSGQLMECQNSSSPNYYILLNQHNEEQSKMDTSFTKGNQKLMKLVRVYPKTPYDKEAIKQISDKHRVGNGTNPLVTSDLKCVKVKTEKISEKPGTIIQPSKTDTASIISKGAVTLSNVISDLSVNCSHLSDVDSTDKLEKFNSILESKWSESNSWKKLVTHEKDIASFNKISSQELEVVTKQLTIFKDLTFKVRIHGQILDSKHSVYRCTVEDVDDVKDILEYIDDFNICPGVRENSVHHYYMLNSHDSTHSAFREGNFGAKALDGTEYAWTVRSKDCELLLNKKGSYRCKCCRAYAILAKQSLKSLSYNA